MEPKFRRMGNGDLCMGDSQEAKKSWSRSAVISEKADVVHKKAVDKVRAMGRDVNCRTTVLSQYMVQWGGYYGRTFKWVLENALGYGAWLVDSMRSEKLIKGVPLSVNKHAFKEYLLSFAEGKEAVEIKAKKRMAKPSTVSGSSVSLPAATLHKLYPSQEARQKVRAMVKPSIRPNLPKTSTTAADWSGSDDELTAAMEQFESTHPSATQLTTPRLATSKTTAVLLASKSTTKLIASKSTTSSASQLIATSQSPLKSSGKPSTSKSTTIPSPSDRLAQPTTSKSTTIPSLSDRLAQPTTSKCTTVPSPSDRLAQPTTSKCTTVPSPSDRLTQPTTSKCTTIPSSSDRLTQPTTSKGTTVASPSDRLTQPTTLKGTTVPSPSDRLTQPTTSKCTTVPSPSDRLTQPTTSKCTTVPSPLDRLTQPTTLKGTIIPSPSKSLDQPTTSKGTTVLSPLKSLGQPTTSKSTTHRATSRSTASSGTPKSTASSDLQADRFPPPTARSESTVEPAVQAVSRSDTEDVAIARPVLKLQTPGSDIDIPSYWHQSFPSVDRKWVAKTLFSLGTQGNFVINPVKANQLWFYPPQPQAVISSKPKLEWYFGHRVFFWQPRRLWKVAFTCPACDGEMKASGLHRTVREVLDIDCFYILLGEAYKCKLCGRNEISWNRAMLDQLDPGHRSYFPVKMMYKTACDVRVIRLLRQRGLGNSPSQLQKKVSEQHCEEWANKHLRYYTDCLAFKKSIKRGLVQAEFNQPPEMTPVPGYQWFQAVYAEDVMLRIDEVKASITSVFGRVLKMDSTKKITKKLAGKSAKTATWCTNISNEHGQVVQSVLTAAEGYLLDKMIQGLVQRYSEAEVPPPELLYVDAHCCGSSPSTNLFRKEWAHLQVRLDVWHFMRRFNSAVTTDTHRLYPTFMSQLSHAIFQWDRADVNLLKKAKRGEMLREHILDPSEEEVIKRITRKEMSLHCRRTTRGTEETTKMLLALLTMFDSDQGKDTMGVPLLNHDRIWEQWRTNKCHVACIQDPPNIPLYTQTGTLKKGGVELPVYRCARGSTSLECFHLHLNRFIPGTSASASHFQAYLLEGMMRWNQDRQTAATSADTGYSLYSGQLRQHVNVLGTEMFGSKLYPNYTPPRKYTGEQIGIDYLFRQTGQVIDPPVYDNNGEEIESAETVSADEEAEEDEGFQDVEDPTISLDSAFLQDLSPAQTQASEATDPAATETQTSAQIEAHQRPCEAAPSATPKTAVHTVPVPSTDPVILIEPRQRPVEDHCLSEESIGPNSVPGYQKVQDLATFLVNLLEKESRVITGSEAAKIVDLWKNLDPYDRSPTKYKAQHRAEHTKGRFKNPKSFRADPIPGVHSVRRCALAPGCGPATKPDANRYMEAIILKLCRRYPSSTTKQGKRYARWTLVHQAYNDILDMVHNCQPIIDQTGIQLSHISQATLSTWYSAMEKKRERQLLEQGLSLHVLPRMASEPLPLPLQKPAAITSSVPADQQHTFPMKDNTAGHCTKVRRKILVKDPVSVPTQQFVPILPKISVTETATDTPLPPVVKIPYSTQHYRKRKLEKEQAGEPKRSYIRTASVTVCRKCGGDKTKGGHKQYYGNIFCPVSCEETYDKWKTQFGSKYKKKKS